jgi:hypothetical protein
MRLGNATGNKRLERAGSAAKAAIAKERVARIRAVAWTQVSIGGLMWRATGPSRRPAALYRRAAWICTAD